MVVLIIFFLPDIFVYIINLKTQKSSLPYSLMASLSDGMFHYKKPNKMFRQILDGQAREFEVHFVPTPDYNKERTDKPKEGTGLHPGTLSKNLNYNENETFTVCMAKKARVSYYVDLLPGKVFILYYESSRRFILTFWKSFEEFKRHLTVFTRLISCLRDYFIYFIGVNFLFYIIQN